ncbi:hypothetical protein [Paraburkholderia caffeinilytica]|uniref:hypothetical protein n=1 Tax=Paraburkholderia caffeinilytica TaxID=1761016 RepID=UPI003DA17218
MNSAPRNSGLGRLRLYHDQRYSDRHAAGPEQAVRYEISVSEPVRLIRAHGARL